MEYVLVIIVPFHLARLMCVCDARHASRFEQKLNINGVVVQLQSFIHFFVVSWLGALFSSSILSFPFIFSSSLAWFFHHILDGVIIAIAIAVVCMSLTRCRGMTNGLLVYCVKMW